MFLKNFQLYSYEIWCMLGKGPVILLNIFFWCSAWKHLLKNIKVTVKSCLVDKEVPAGVCVIDDDVTFKPFCLKKVHLNLFNIAKKGVITSV